MIGFLQGQLLCVDNGVATLRVGGVGYEIHQDEPGSWEPAPGSTYSDRAFWVHEHAPQDAPHELYGFKLSTHRDLFRRLLRVKGVGPKVAARIVASGWQPGGGMPHVRGVGPKIEEGIREVFDE